MCGKDAAQSKRAEKITAKRQEGEIRSMAMESSISIDAFVRFYMFHFCSLFLFFYFFFCFFKKTLFESVKLVVIVLFCIIMHLQFHCMAWVQNFNLKIKLEIWRTINIPRQLYVYLFGTICFALNNIEKIANDKIFH